MALDFGTIASQGVGASIQNLPRTIQANVANVPGLEKRLGFFQGLMDQPLNEQEIADYFNQANAAAAMKGQAASPAQILQNVLGLETMKRDVRTGAAQQLGQATQFMQLNPFQPSEGVQGAQNAAQFNEQLAAQYRASRGQTPSLFQRVAPIALGLGAATFGPGLLGLGGAGAMAGEGVSPVTPSTVSGAGAGAAGAMGAGAAMTPFQTAALRLGMFGAGTQVGQSLFGFQ